MCSVGHFTKSPCSTDYLKNATHTPLYLVAGKHNTGNSHFKLKKDFDKLSRFLIRIRSGCQNFTSICQLHEEEFLTKFPSQQLVCCNPLGIHAEDKLKIYKNRQYDLLRLITVKMYKASQKLEFSNKMIPGKKLCYKCYKKCCSQMEKNVSCVLSSSSDGETEEDYLYNIALNYH